MKARKWVGGILLAAVFVIGFFGCHKSETAETGGMQTTPELTVTNMPAQKSEREVTDTPIPTPTDVPAPTPSNTPISEPKLTNTPAPTPTDVPTPKPTATDTPTSTITPKPTTSPTPTFTPSPTVSPKPTVTPKPTATPLPAYQPAEHGYTEKVGEWKYGENITATLWWNGIEWVNDGKACVLVFEGTGETWTAKEVEAVYNLPSAPWIWLDDYRDYIFEAEIGEGITKIEDLQLYDIKEITLPNSLEEVGEYTFAGSKLNSIVIPEGVKRIGEYAFSRSKLTSVVIPEGVEYIGECAFNRCNLTEIKLPASLKFLGNSAFGIQYVVNAEKNLVPEVIIPTGVETIEFGAFIGRYGMKIYLEGRSSDAGFAKGWNDGGFDREIEVIYNYER